ncbi:DNA-directed RNA polymerase III subunit RPC5-like [Chenopodium quinoa]|uniref:DNA-directed RNA polymerase III subunit RPC5-like n=1 Tax=Chenopodium quinoa TaxID=63459 RepID=UPI000B79A922|nr:DNA-directed RNA polymerase III subunit RPC5-like [Chenopodium quinoa]
MDFEDLDDPFQAPKPKPSRYAPKNARFQPKTKNSGAMKSEPKVEVKKEEDTTVPVAAAKMDVDSVELKEEVMEEREIPETSNSMEEDVEEDCVVAEYDVYFTPRDPATQLYVLQYPLRPSWRPYELEQRCTEVRYKPKSGEVEVDLSIDTNSDNYLKSDMDDGKLVTQTLSSSCRPPQTTSYAVGVLFGKKLYLNPIHAVVQLRPSMESLDSCGSKIKQPNVTFKEEGSNNSAVAGPSRKEMKQMDPEAVEPWTSLKYHSSATGLAEKYLRKMVTEQKDPLQFLMNPYDYVNSLCPKAVINKMTSRGPSKRFLLSLPLEERIKTLLVEGPSIQRFIAIKHLAPDDPVEEVLEILQKYAHLVQGLWVPKSSIRHPNARGPEILARDYALLLFSQRPFIKDTELDVLGSQKSTGKVVLRELAVERPSCKDWKFKEATDVSFMKLHPDVVEKQMKLWEVNGQLIQQKFANRKAGQGSRSSNRPGSSTPSDEGAVRATTVARSASTSMSKETQEALPKVLKKLFQSHKVCSFQTICRGLRDMAVSMSALPKADARAAVAAAKGVDAPQEELHAAICEIAYNVHGVYMLKSSSEHPEFDQLRKLVVDLFLGSWPNAKLKKGEFMEAAKIRLQKEPSNSEFQKVITELCVSKGGAWVLKSGDGVPS